jgi:hypothetical protein
MMISTFLRAALGASALLASGLLGSAAFAAATDYRVEVVSARAAGAGKTDVTIRLIRVPDNKPVPDAVIFQTRADMAPAGMPTMTGNVSPPAAQQPPGTYRLQVETGMAGNWALTLSAKVQGEAETVRATVPFSAAQ